MLQIPGGDLLWSLALSSPQGTIEEAAARELANRYTSIAQSHEVTLSEVEVAHVELVEQCMKELRSAYRTLRGGTDEDDLKSRIRFGRVLMFQKQMLELVRQKPEFNRARRADSKVESMDSDNLVGNAIAIRYQIDGKKQSILIAPDHTIDDLYHRLCRATGCTRINLFAGGQKLDTAQRAHVTMADANLDGELLVHPVQRDEKARAVSTPVAGSSEFETNLVKHFDEMFAWMDADDDTSQLVSPKAITYCMNANDIQLFDFLTLFPYRSTITNSVVSGEATLDELFPTGKFFQAKYAAQAVHSKLKDQVRSVSVLPG